MDYMDRVEALEQDRDDLVARIELLEAVLEKATEDLMDDDPSAEVARQWRRAHLARRRRG